MPVIARAIRSHRGFEHMYRRHVPSIYRYTLGVLGNEAPLREHEPRRLPRSLLSLRLGVRSPALIALRCGGASPLLSKVIAVQAFPELPDRQLLPRPLS